MRRISLIVRDEDAGRQIKHVLASRLGISRRQLSRLKQTDGMRVNGSVVHANYVVSAGDEIEALIDAEPMIADADAVTVTDAAALSEDSGDLQPSAALTAKRCAELDAEYAPLILRLSPSGAAHSQSELAAELIVYEDEDMIVLNKPAPLPTGASARQRGLTLESVLYSRYCALPAWQFRPVNRLDRGTSGLMAVAKSAYAHYALQRQLHTDAYVRMYQAVVVGAPPESEGVIELPIGRAPDSIVRRMVTPDGKPSVTRYRTLYSDGAHSVVELILMTGRTHQIRVHMAAVGCPVYGDFLYGEEEEELPDRFALHSHYLRCVQPVSGMTLEFRVPLPAELRRIVPNFRTNPLNGD